MEEPTCKLCKYFIQHFTLDNERCTAINCGHCTYPHLKNRRPGTPACAHFRCREDPVPLPNRAEVLHFLTKDMLEYIMGFALPPEVEGLPRNNESGR